MVNKNHFVIIFLLLIATEFILIICYNEAYGQLFELKNINPVLNTIPVGEHPIGIAIDPNSRKVYVINSFSDSVSVINETTDKVIGSPIPVGTGPVGIAIDSEDRKVYVANEYSNTVSVIKETTDKVIGSPILVGENPINILIENALNIKNMGYIMD